MRTITPPIQEAGDELTSAVQAALAALEQNGVSIEDADEFVRECVFNAWVGWTYEASNQETRGDG